MSCKSIFSWQKRFLPDRSSFKKLINLAEEGDKSAQYHLSSVYYNGWGVAQDYDNAAEWFCEARKQSFERPEDGVNFTCYKE